MKTITSRWDVKNLLHRYLDVSFSEDLNKTMNANRFNNFSIMNKLCLSLLNLAKPIIGRSMIRMRKSFSMAPVSYLFSILANIIDVLTLFIKFIKGFNEYIYIIVKKSLFRHPKDRSCWKKTQFSLV